MTMNCTIFLPNPESQRGEVDVTHDARTFLDKLKQNGYSYFVTKGLIEPATGPAETNFLIRLDIPVSDHDTCLIENGGTNMPLDVAKLVRLVAEFSQLIDMPVTVILPCRHMHDIDERWISWLDEVISLHEMMGKHAPRREAIVLVDDGSGLARQSPALASRLEALLKRDGIEAKIKSSPWAAGAPQIKSQTDGEA